MIYYIIPFILLPLMLLIICAKSFEMLPCRIFLDFDESTKLFSKPYIKQNDSCISCLIFLFAVFVTISMQFYNLNDISNLQLIRNILIFILLGHIFISDFLFQIIPDEHLILLLFVNIGNFNFHSLLGGACGFFPFFLLTMLTYLLIGNPAIGFGDIKLLSVLGLLTAPTAILAVQILASTLSGVFCMGILIYKFLCKIQKDKALANATGFVPLAPFIIFAFAIIYSL